MTLYADHGVISVYVHNVPFGWLGKPLHRSRIVILRVRPKAMSVAVILAGLFPIMWGTGTGSEVMQRIAAPMVGGMITAPLVSMFVIPAVYLLMRRPRRAAPTASFQDGAAPVS